jgi:hypothetical protein
MRKGDTMKKRTIVAKLKDRLVDDIKANDLELVGGGKITIVGSGSSVTAVSGDPGSD